MGGGTDSAPLFLSGPLGPSPVPDEVRRHRLFEDLPEADLAYLMGLARISHHPKRHMLFTQGEPCDGLFLVLAGVVRLYQSAPDGREHVVEIIRKGQSFAEAAVFADVPYPVHAETLGPCRLMFLPKEPYLAFLRAHPRHLFQMVASLSVRMHQLVVKVERLTLRDAVQRTAAYLLDMADQDLCVNLDVTKATLASQLGLTPETLSRAFASLHEQGLVAMDGNHFHVRDVEALYAIQQ